MGVDPGITHMGIVILSWGTGAEKPKVEKLRLVKTPGTPEKELRRKKGRRTVDDQRRLKLQWEAMREEGEGCHAFGVEAYTVGRDMGKNAWKTALSYQGAVAFAWTLGIEPNITLPMDLKREFIGAKAGGKVQVLGQVIQEVSGLDVQLEQFPPGAWEHLSDATGHAVLALRRYLQQL